MPMSCINLIRRLLQSIMAPTPTREPVMVASYTKRQACPNFEFSNCCKLPQDSILQFEMKSLSLLHAIILCTVWEYQMVTEAAKFLC